MKNLVNFQKIFLLEKIITQLENSQLALLRLS